MEKPRNNGRVLMIVDPQIDFITGSLPVPGAEGAMDRLAEYVRTHGDEYEHIFVTCDRHSLRHCSFRSFGGEWPPHCIESSVGAAVWPRVMKELLSQSGRVRIFYKGESRDRDEYSIFQSEKGAAELDPFLREGRTMGVDICGLAGDVCVRTTLDDLRRLYPQLPVRLLDDFTAYITS